MSCDTPLVTVFVGAEEDPLELPSTCDAGLSWVTLSLPQWGYRYAYAPPSVWVQGNVLLSAVPDSGEVAMVVSVEGTSLADVEDQKAALEAALAAWPGEFKAVATDDNGNTTIAGPWQSFPTIPRWGDVLPTVLGYYLVEATFSIPVNPIGAP